MAARRLLVLACALGILGSASPGLAHDYWIRPGAFQLKSPGAVDLRLFVGTRGDVVEHPYRRRATTRFLSYGPRGVARVRTARQQPAGRVVATDSGVHTLVFQSRHSYIELPAKKFEHYLLEEGLEHVARQRKRTGQSTSPGKESYFRNCKSLLRVGSSTRGFDRRVGLPFEITAQTNPFGGGVVELVVERHGRPAAGIKVDLISLDGLRVTAEAVSDQRGRIRVRVPRRGSWMLAATDMRRAPRGVRGDWESAWTSLTFETRG